MRLARWIAGWSSNSLRQRPHVVRSSRRCLLPPRIEQLEDRVVPTLIDFGPSTISVGTVVSNQYLNLNGGTNNGLQFIADNSGDTQPIIQALGSMDGPTHSGNSQVADFSFTEVTGPSALAQFGSTTACSQVSVYVGEFFRAGGPFSEQVTLTAFDASGIPLGSSTATVVSGQGFHTNLTVNDSQGRIATFQITGNGVDVGLDDLTFNNKADHLGFSVQPSNTRAGFQISPSVQVQVFDKFGSVITGDNSDQVTLNVASGPAGFASGSRTTATVVNGVATFAFLILDTVGTYTLGESGTGGVSGPNSNSFAITPGSANHLAFSVQPSNSTAGAAISPAVQVKVLDQFGNLETADNSDQVSLNMASGPGGFAAGSTNTVTVSGGIANFSNLVLDTAGTYTLNENVFFNGNAILTGSNSTSFVVKAAAADHLGFTVQPSNSTAGAAISPAVQVTVFDKFGNPLIADNSDVVTLFVASGPGSFSGSTTTVPVVNGIATFTNLILDTAGPYTLGESATGGLSGPNSNSFTVKAAAADHLSFSVQPSNTTAGVAINPAVQVQVLDKFGNLLTADNSDQVTVSVVSGPGGFASGSTTTTTVSGGGATFSNLVLDTAGMYTLGETATGGITGPNSSSFTVNAAAADHLSFSVQPSNTTAGAAINAAVQVKVLDRFGNLLTADNSDQVTVSVASGPGAFAGGSTTTVTVSGGVATFSNLVLDTAGPYTLGESATGGLSGPNSSSFTINAAAAKHLAFSVQPSNTTAGVAISPAVQVQVFDRFGNPLIADNSDQVTLSVASGPGALAGGSTTTATVSGGIAIFINLVLDTAGMYTLSESATGGLTGPSSSSFTINAAAADHLGFSVQPGNTTAGAAINPAVQVKVFDRFGNPLTADNSDQVTLSVAIGPGSFAAGSTTTVTVSSGIATFSNLAIDTTGTYTLGESATGSISGPASSIFTVNPAPADHLSISAPARVSMNGPFSVSVVALDHYGNVAPGYSGPATLALSAAPAGGKLAGKLVGQFTAGQATFPGLSLNVLGAYTLFSAGSGPVLAGTAQVNVSTITHFGVTLSGVPAGGLVAGQPVMATVAALDASGAIVTDYAGTIHFTSSDSLAGLPANYTFTTGTGGDNGSHTFSIPLETAGMQTITATSTAQPKLTGTSPPVVVVAAAVDHLLISGYPKTDVSGQAHSATVLAVDAFNNPVTSYTGTVTLSSSDGAAMGLPASFNITAGDGGSHTVTNVILTTVGSQSLSAQDTTQNLTSSPYTVKVQSPATRLVASGPSSVVAGTPFTITVKALAGSVLDTQFPDTVGFSSSDPFAGPGDLPANTTFTKSDKGSRQFTITLITAGTQTITISDLTRGSVAPFVLTLPVGPGDVTGFGVGYTAGGGFSAIMHADLFAALPAMEDVAGAAHNLTVKATDAYGNVVPSYTGIVQLSSSDSQTRGLPASYTFTPGDHGMHTFTGVILNTVSAPGSPTQVSVEDTTHNLSGGTQIPVQSAAKSLSASGPKTTVAGQSFTITVRALAGRKIDSQFPDTVSFSTSDSQAQTGLPAPATFGAADQGSKQFTITLLTAGRQTVTITDVTRGRINRAVFTIQVNPTGFGRLQVIGYPATTLLGAKHSFLVRAEDIYGNVVPSYRGTVDLASTDPASSPLPASYTFTAKDRGVHPFSVAFNTIGAWALNAVDSVNMSISGSLAVNAATLTAGITPPPGPIVRGQAASFTLSASEDGATSATVFTWQVDWNGDGKVDQTFTGAPGQTSMTVSHVFATMGTDTVTVRVKDSSGNLSPQSATATVQVVPIALETQSDGSIDLVIGGTTGKDSILIQPVNDTSGQTVSVSINGVVQSIGGQTAFSPTGHIVVYGQGGGDTIAVQSNSIGGQTVEVAIPAVLFSGGGNSTLSVAGSSAANVLVGGSGTDKLTGGSGADILIGGAGKDVLQAGPGSDVLINSSTIYDANLAALLALSAEWGSGQSYQTRVQDLYYGGAGALNGSILLNAGAVNHDAHSISNRLFGSPGGLDWFWLAAGTDKLSGETTGEVVTLD
jgi:hypothetical protein